jgi:hypothetical protein
MICGIVFPRSMAFTSPIIIIIIIV